MNVVTLDESGFNEVCVVLAKSIAERGDAGALIGIRTGGAAVATLIFEYLRELDDSLEYYEAGASRFTSAAKAKGGTKTLFKYLPGFVLDWLRVLEHYYVRFRMKLFSGVERSIRLDSDLLDYLDGLDKGCIYIIDDAIDSGATIHHLLGELNRKNSKLEYKIAVLVVTQDDPLVSPDISLYSNVLLRFPWSSDYRS